MLPVTAAPVTPIGAATSASCHYAQSRRIAESQDRGIKEASALVASRQWPGVFWTLNDSGNPPNIYALDDQGRPLGTFRVPNAENEDWEAMQLGPGPNGGWALYIGDIGDNNAKRKEIAIYRVPEPEPFPVGARNANGRTASADEFRFDYPDGAHDAEALLVHPTTGEALIVTKETLGRAGIYRVPRVDQSKRVTLEHIADLDMARAGVKIDVVTDGTVSADARRLTIRTYGSLLEYSLSPGASLTSVWGQTPYVARLHDGPQAEGITYRPDGSALISIDEGTPALLYETRWQC